MQLTQNIAQKQSIKDIQPWFVVFAAALFFLFAFINMNSFDALNNDLRHTFHVNALQISYLSAMYFYANVLFLIPAGLLLDRFSTKKILMVAISIATLANFLFSFTDKFWVVALCRFTIGMSSTTCLLTTALLASRWFPANKNALVMGLVITIAMFGGFVAQYIDNISLLLGGWRSAIFAIGCLGLVFLVIISILVKDFPESSKGYHSKHTNSQKLKEAGFFTSLILALKNPQNWLCGTYTNLLSIPVIVLGALWSKDYLITANNLSSNQAAFVTAMIFWGLIFGSPFNGALSDRLKNRKFPMFVGAFLTLIISLIIIYVPHLSFMSLVVLFFLIGFFSGAQVIVYALVSESNPKHITASSQALSATIIMASGAIFEPLYGYLLQYHAHERVIYTAADYRFAMIILPVAFIVSLIVVACMKESKCRSLSE